MDPTTVSGAALAVGITELFKPYIPKKLWPLLTFFVALLWSLMLQPPTTVAAAADNLQQALLMAAGGTGVYAAGKHVVTTPASTPGTKATPPVAPSTKATPAK